MLAGQQYQVAYQHVRGDGDRVFYHTAFMAFHLGHFQCLFFGTHVLVNNADTAFLRHGNGQAGFGNRIHGSGYQRQIQGDIAGEAGVEGNVARQYSRMGRDEENVVESIGFLDDAHLGVSLGGKNALYRSGRASAKPDAPLLPVTAPRCIKWPAAWTDRRFL